LIWIINSGSETEAEVSGTIANYRLQAEEIDGKSDGKNFRGGSIRLFTVRSYRAVTVKISAVTTVKSTHQAVLEPEFNVTVRLLLLL
jgi:hypothetical protein